MKTICLADAESLSGQYYYRAQLPYRHLRQELLDHGVGLVKGLQPGCDAYMWSNAIAIGFDEIIKMKDQGIKIIAGFDDHPFCTPEWHPKKADWYKVDEMAREWVELADHVVVSTEEFHHIISPGPKVHVLPNLIDFDDYSVYRPKNPQPTVLWAGSNSHLGDLEMIEDPIIKLASEFPEVMFAFWGCRLPPKLRKAQDDHDNILFLPWIGSVYKYHEHLMNLAPLVGLCPLIDHPFNRCKSSIKWAEYTLAGAAAVCSPVGAYETDTKDGDTALWACSREDWHPLMKVLLTRQALGDRMHTNARDEVYDNHSWHQASTKRESWKKFFLEVCS